MNRKIKFLLKFLVTSGFLIWVIYVTNWKEVLFYLEEIEWWIILSYISILLLGIIISSHKWQLIAKFKGIHLPIWSFFKFYLTGTFINNFMPSFIAGDTYKAYQIGNIRGNYPEAASTVMMDRITGFIGATILSLIFSILNYKVVMENKLLLIMNLILILSFFIDIIITKLRSMPVLKKLAYKYLPSQVLEFLRELYSFKDKKVIFNSVVLSMLFSIIGVAFLNYILFLGLGIKVSILNYLSVIFLISVISAIPISINNIGVKEWAYITLFGAFGANQSAIITAALMSRILQMIVSFIALPMYLKTSEKFMRYFSKN